MPGAPTLLLFCSFKDGTSHLPFHLMATCNVPVSTYFPVSRVSHPPKISVIIPTYNREKLLPLTLDSILGQSCEDFEIIVVDDGSTDGTRAAIDARGDPRIRYVYKQNGGESSATNYGWRLARGRYAAVVSSDDPVLPGWMETMEKFMDANPSILVAYPDWRLIDIDGNLVQHLKTEEYAFTRMVSWLLTMPGPGSFIRREALGDFGDLRDAQYRYAPDLETWLRLALRGDFARVPHELASWRTHATSITVADRSLARAREMPRLVRHFFSRPDLPPEIRRQKRYALSRAYWTAAWILHENRPLLSDWYLLRSYWLAPNDPPELPAYLKRFHRPSPARLWRNLLVALGLNRN